MIDNPYIKGDEIRLIEPFHHTIEKKVRKTLSIDAVYIISRVHERKVFFLIGKKEVDMHHTLVRLSRLASQIRKGKIEQCLLN